MTEGYLMNRVKDKVIIVTGGASGIGHAACCLLAQHGAHVAVVDINESLGKKTVAAIQEEGGEAHFWQLDTRHEKQVNDVITAIVDHYGRIDVLVNNVGMVGKNKPTHELTEEDWDTVMAVNVKSVFFCTKYVVPHLKRNGGGSIINISSLHGLIGSPDFPANHASKAAVRLMSKTDAMLYAKDKIRVNSIHPGYIATPLLDGVANQMKITSEQLKKQLPENCVGEPIDVAYAILYLASDESKFMTASELVIDGGLHGGRDLGFS